MDELEIDTMAISSSMLFLLSTELNLTDWAVSMTGAFTITKAQQWSKSDQAHITLSKIFRFSDNQRLVE